MKSTESRFLLRLTMSPVATEIRAPYSPPNDRRCTWSTFDTCRFKLHLNKNGKKWLPIDTCLLRRYPMHESANRMTYLKAASPQVKYRFLYSVQRAACGKTSVEWKPRSIAVWLKIDISAYRVATLKIDISAYRVGDRQLSKINPSKLRFHRVLLKRLNNNLSLSILKRR